MVLFCLLLMLFGITLRYYLVWVSVGFKFAFSKKYLCVKKKDKIGRNCPETLTVRNFEAQILCYPESNFPSISLPPQMHNNFKELCRNTPEWCRRMRMLNKQRARQQHNFRGASDQMRSRRQLTNTVLQRMATMQKVQKFMQRNIRTIRQLRLRRSTKNLQKIFK